MVSGWRRRPTAYAERMEKAVPNTYTLAKRYPTLGYSLAEKGLAELDQLLTEVVEATLRIAREQAREEAEEVARRLP